MQLTDIVKEILWIKQILEELNYEIKLPIIINIDNRSTIKIAEKKHLKTLPNVEVRYCITNYFFN